MSIGQKLADRAYRKPLHSIDPEELRPVIQSRLTIECERVIANLIQDWERATYAPSAILALACERMEQAEEWQRPMGDYATQLEWSADVVRHEILAEEWALTIQSYLGVHLRDTPHVADKIGSQFVFWCNEYNSAYSQHSLGVCHNCDSVLYVHGEVAA